MRTAIIGPDLRLNQCYQSTLPFWGCLMELGFKTVILLINWGNYFCRIEWTLKCILQPIQQLDFFFFLVFSFLYFKQPTGETSGLVSVGSDGALWSESVEDEKSLLTGNTADIEGNEYAWTSPVVDSLTIKNSQQIKSLYCTWIVKPQLGYTALANMLFTCWP